MIANIIAVLENSISLITLLAGYILGELILALITPAGFIALFSLMIFVGQLMVRNVLKDIKIINIKNWKNIVKEIGL